MCKEHAAESTPLPEDDVSDVDIKLYKTGPLEAQDPIQAQDSRHARHRRGRPAGLAPTGLPLLPWAAAFRPTLAAIRET